MAPAKAKKKTAPKATATAKTAVNLASFDQATLRRLMAMAADQDSFDRAEELEAELDPDADAEEASNGDSSNEIQPVDGDGNLIEDEEEEERGSNDNLAELDRLSHFTSSNAQSLSAPAKKAKTNLLDRIRLHTPGNTATSGLSSLPASSPSILSRDPSSDAFWGADGMIGRTSSVHKPSKKSNGKKRARSPSGFSSADESSRRSSQHPKKKAKAAKSKSKSVSVPGKGASSKRPPSALGDQSAPEDDDASNNELDDGANDSDGPGDDPNTRNYWSVPIRRIIDRAAIDLCSVLMTSDPFAAEEDSITNAIAAWNRTVKQMGKPNKMHQEGQIKAMLASVTSLRSRLKGAVLSSISSFYKFDDRTTPEAINANKDKVKWLLKENHFTFHKHTPPSGKEPAGMYYCELIQDVIKDMFFSHRKALGIKHPIAFNPIPIPTVAFALTVIQFGISLWQTGVQANDSFTVENNRPIYDQHLQWLNKWKYRKPVAVPSYQVKLYETAVARSKFKPEKIIEKQEIPDALFDEEYDPLAETEEE